MKTVLLILALTLSIATAVTDSLAAEKIDAVLPHPGSADVPGCAVGVQAGDSAPIRRAFGMADLEHSVPISVDTVFEAGSVSKQFTAAAVLILVNEGRLSLDDDVHKYIPELPDYGHRITLAELMGHTSGLRDWGDIEAIAGWPRTERAYDMADVLQIAARQRALNFTPGTAWSYTNTGYNLLAMIVQRVSGSSFVDFTHDHLFAPLGMTHTQWRDDFRRIVPGRAIAYHWVSEGNYEQLMPFENTYGHGGLLTTVGDLLIWNKALDDARLGASVTNALQTRTLLVDGRPTGYARGIFVRSYAGMREMSHDGATAGYRAWLGRYPDQHLSIAILCNADDAHTSDLAHSIADRYLPEKKAEQTTYSMKPPATLAGIYKSERDGSPLRLVLHGESMQTDAGPIVMAGPNGTFAFEHTDGSIAKTGALLPDGRISLYSEGDTTVYARTAAYTPSSADLARIAGRYRNDEVPVTYQISATKDGLNVLAEGRPGQTHAFSPVYSSAFISGNTILRPVFDSNGTVTGIRISEERVWNLLFSRQP